MSPTLVILAAGIGRRYGGLKQLDPVGPSGEFMVDYAVYDALRSGFKRVVFVIRKDLETDFRATIGKRIERQTDVRYVFQELSDLPEGYDLPSGREKPWGTGHALLSAASVVDGPLAAINADDFYGRESFEALGRFLIETAGRPREYAMVGFKLRNTLSDHGSVARGICSVRDDRTLANVVERTSIEKRGEAVHCDEQPLTGEEIASMNLWGFKPSFFAHLSSEFRAFLDNNARDPKAEFFIPTVVNTLIESGNAGVSVLPTSCTWFGATYPEDKSIVVTRIRELIADGHYPESLWSGT